MSLDAGDLRAAVAAGIVTEAQAARLAALGDARRTGTAAARPGEEPFELFRGLNEIFIVVGLTILGIGWFGVWAAASALADWDTTWLLAFGSGLVIVALLSEYIIRRRRMVAPAILLTIAWAVFAFALLALSFEAVTLLGGLDPVGSIAPLSLTCLAVGAFWLRYRVPFAVAVLAASAFAALMLSLAAATGQAVTTESLLLLSSEGPFAWGTLAFGLVLFAVAMRFDMSDPHRVTLRASNGFWLHVVAAPAIVNTLALTLIDGGGGAGLVLATILLAIAAVAVVIDRRSFLISAAGYTVALIFTATEGDGVAPVILGLGAGLVALGAGWARARAALVAPLPSRLRDRLPPTA